MQYVFQEMGAWRKFAFQWGPLRCMLQTIFISLAVRMDIVNSLSAVYYIKFYKLSLEYNLAP